MTEKKSTELPKYKVMKELSDYLPDEGRFKVEITPDNERKKIKSVRLTDTRYPNSQVGGELGASKKLQDQLNAAKNEIEKLRFKLEPSVPEGNEYFLFHELDGQCPECDHKPYKSPSAFNTHMEDKHGYSTKKLEGK